MTRSILLACVLALVACSRTAGPECTGTVSRVSTGGPSLDVQIADDDAEREHGLMGVTGLGADEGMAFVWDQPVDGTFWMKDTLIPLSIAFVGADGRIVTISEMTPCPSEPCRTYGAAGPYTMAVEANAGWFGDHGLEVGDPVSLEQVCPS